MGLVVTQRLHAVVYHDRQHLCLARNVAADHQHHAELTDRVRETQHGRRDETASRLRQHHAHETVERRGAQRRRRLQYLLTNSGEGVLQGLHDKRQRINHRTNQETREAERERGAGEIEPRTADRAVRPEHDEQIKAQHRRRYFLWFRVFGFVRGLPTFLALCVFFCVWFVLFVLV